jgi:hypothetical protein
MRRAILVPLLLATAPARGQDIELAPGMTLETRLDGDLNGDEVNDIAFISGNGDTRALTVLLSDSHEVHVDFNAETLELEPTGLGPGVLKIAGNVLTLEDLTGGTTAHATTYRFRHDGARKRMRLIGMDVTLYSRTFAHDGYEMSWNLITGDTTAHELRLANDGTDRAYADTAERRFKRRTRPVWLSETPDPDTLLEETSQD